MACIAISDAAQSRFCLGGADGAARPTLIDGALARGSLMVEARPSPEGHVQTLLSFERLHPRPYKLSIQAVPGGGLVLIIADGDDVFHCALHHDSQDRADILRLTYSWDTLRSWGRLAIERPEVDRVASVDLNRAPPLQIEDIRAISSDPRRRHLDRDVLFFAVSDGVEPIGPMPSLAGDVPILCQGRYAPAGGLRRGDMVETLESGLSPVLQVVRRTVPARGSFRPVRLRAPYFGLLRDVVVAPDQRLVVGGSEVEYTFGREAVLVPARHLVNGISAIALGGRETVTYTQVILGRHDSLIAAGCPVESLYVGRIRRKRAQLDASLLAPFERALLPEHARSAYLMVKPFEAITLMQRRAA